jgi:hypothetical protein
LLRQRDASFLKGKRSGAGAAALDGKRLDVWDEDVPDPINNLEAAQRIRRICGAAADVAKNVSSRAGESAEKERYERAAKTAMQIALKISDDLCAVPPYARS